MLLRSDTLFAHQLPSMKNKKQRKDIQDQNPSRFRNLWVGQFNLAEVGQF